MPGRIDLRAEHGATLILVAVTLPLLIMFASFALDVSNWFVHKRHLQVQADAAALAGAAAFQIDGCDDATIREAAQRYSGSRPDDYNRQVGTGADNVTFVPNATPCADRAVDVRMSESDLPWFLRIANLLDVAGNVSVGAASRIDVRQLQTSDDMTPLGVEADKITHVRAFLVDENGDTNTPIPPGRGEVTSQDLSVVGSAGGQDTWATSAPLHLDRVVQRNIGVRVAVSYGTGSGCPTSADVTCYSKDAGGIGLVHIHSFTQPPDVTTGAPALRSAELESCPSSPGPSFTTQDCTLTVRALVDWNDKVDTALDAETAKASPDCSSVARVRARLGGLTGTAVDLHCVRPAPGQPSTFEGTLPVSAGAGALPLRLTYVQYAGKNAAGRDCGDGTGKDPSPCWGAWDDVRAIGTDATDQVQAVGLAGPVNRVYAGGPTRTDGISSMTVTYAGGARAGLPANAVPYCPSGPQCGQSFNVTVGLPSPLEVGDQRDLATKSPGANDQLLDCDPNRNGAASVEDTIARGCPQKFAVQSESADCPPYSAFGPGLPEPWSCVPTFKGNPARATNGMTRRVFFGGGALRPVSAADCAAHPDNWPNWQRDPADPRIVGVFLTGRGTFDANNDHVMPVRDFAYFYVRGWGGDPCAASAGNGGSDLDVPDGVIRGSFIKYVRRNDGGVTASDDTCNTSSLGGCVPVMTR